MQGDATDELGELDGVGTPSSDDGLGGAPSGRCILGPMIVVEAVLDQIICGGVEFNEDAFLAGTRSPTAAWR
eukprot:5120292-Alexandrium_andersonii.AAC.1